MNRLIQGDCLEVMDELIKEGVIVDAIITDPPYGTTACKWDTVIPFDEMWKRLNKLIKPNGAIVLFGSEPFSSALRMSNIKNYKYDWIWDKKKGGNPLLSKIQPIKITENILVFNSKIYYPQMTKRDKPKSRGSNKGIISATTGNAFIDNKIYTQKYPKNIIEVSNASQVGKIHPTQKPVKLLKQLIEIFTDENDTVIDPCAGSGTTLRACMETNRSCYGFELHKDFYNRAANEMLKEKEDMALKLFEEE